MIYNSVLVRFTGEFGVKSTQTQELMEGILRRNLQNALIAVGGSDLWERLQVIARPARYYLVPRQPSESDIPTIISVVGRTFGISTISPCFQTAIKDVTSTRTIPAKLMLAHDLFPSKIAIRTGGNTDIDVKAWKQDIYALCEKFSREDQSSRGISKKRFQVNERWDMGPWACQREKKLEIEVFEKHAYISAERIKAPGGFPLGLEDPLVALVSGGFDSPVAAWLAMKRGVPLIFLIMDPADGRPSALGPGTSTREKALQQVQILHEYMHGLATAPLVFMVPYGTIQSSLQSLGEDAGITCLLCKRTMYRVAEQVAVTYGAKGIVTGEILGEQASQTAQNLMVLNNVAHLPVHRPLFGFDKEEVVKLSRQIGVARAAEVTTLPCPFVPEHPSVRGELEVIEEIEEKLGVDVLVEQCLQQMYLVDITGANNS
jgi:thiamine biosynthesis protein ThiI